MKRIKVSEPINCQCCGNEFNSYQLKTIKIGSKVLDVCTKCIDICNSYSEASDLIRNAQQAIDQELQSPNVIVEPMQPVINKAVEVLKRMDPSYFVGVRKIKAGVSPNFGFVQSGPGSDPTIININMSMISQKAKEYNASAVFAAAITISHERAHVKSFDPQQGFKGGESPAEAEEKRVAAWIEQNKDRLKDLDVS